MRIFKDTVEVFEGERGGWYWSLRNNNGLITADGSEPYSTSSNARRAARRAGRSLIFASIESVTRSYPRRGKPSA
ncbi:MAG: DUF1508 domain-containing protein [bacterium]|nr:DUF1508 domain-containing protein [bacterium]